MLPVSSRGKETAPPVRVAPAPCRRRCKPIDKGEYSRRVEVRESARTEHRLTACVMTQIELLLFPIASRPLGDASYAEKGARA
jgi:hypothetical protein